jgi:site-specific recombinase XerD
MGNGNDEVPVSQATTAMLESWGRSLHDRSPRTRALYLSVGRMFARHLTAKRGSDDLTTVTRWDCEGWFADQRDAGLSAATLRSRWIALRTLYGWLLDVDEIDDNPMGKVHVSKPKLGPIPIPTDEDLRAVLATCSGKDLANRRDLAVLRLMAGSGLRLSECANLRTGDLDLNNRVVLVHGKGGRTRMVRFDPATADAVDRYVRIRGRHRDAASPWLWLGRARGNDGFRFTRAGIATMVGRRAKLAGVDHINPHQLRHYFADRFLKAGGNEGDLQRLGGWESAEVMRRYGRAHAVERALAAYDTAAPLTALEHRARGNQP